MTERYPLQSPVGSHLAASALVVDGCDLSNPLLRAMAGFLVGKSIHTEASPEGYPVVGTIIGLLLGYSGLAALAGYGLWKNR
jgi:hypothetical protein